MCFCIIIIITTEVFHIISCAHWSRALHHVGCDIITSCYRNVFPDLIVLLSGGCWLHWKARSESSGCWLIVTAAWSWAGRTESAKVHNVIFNELCFYCTGSVFEMLCWCCFYMLDQNLLVTVSLTCRHKPVHLWSWGIFLRWTHRSVWQKHSFKKWLCTKTGLKRMKQQQATKDQLWKSYSANKNKYINDILPNKLCERLSSALKMDDRRICNKTV